MMTVYEYDDHSAFFREKRCALDDDDDAHDEATDDHEK